MKKFNCYLLVFPVFLSCLFWNTSYVFAQTDSVVTSIRLSLDANKIPNSNNGYYVRSTYDSLGRLIKKESGANPPMFYSGNQSYYQYDAIGRLISTKDFNLDASGNKTLKYEFVWNYDSSGFVTYYKFFNNFGPTTDSIVYFRDAQGRDTLNILYNAQGIQKIKKVTEYYSTIPASSKTEEFLYDTIIGSWNPHELHKYQYTSFDSVYTDTTLKYQTGLGYVISGLQVHYYDSYNFKIRIENYLGSSPPFLTYGCEKWSYNPATHLMISHSISIDSCNSNNISKLEYWYYDNAGRLIHEIARSKSFGNPSYNLIDYDKYYYNDSLGRLSYFTIYAEYLGFGGVINKARTYGQYLYADKGVWKATIVAPHINKVYCAGQSSILYSLMCNEPLDAVSKWSKNGVFSGTGNSFTFLTHANERIGLSGYSPSTNVSVNPPFVVMSVQGTIPQSILYNGSADDIEKCEGKYVKLVSNSSSLKDFKWFLNGSLLGSFNGSSSINVVAPGTYRCESTFIAAPNCSYSDEIKVSNITPDPNLKLSGTGIANRKNSLSDVNSEPGSTYIWFKNGQEIPAVHDEVINISKSGTYYCQVTNIKGCTKQSPDFKVNLLNSNTENEGVWIKNPVQDHQLQVSFDSDIWPPDPSCSWNITDVLGRVIYNGSINHQNIYVDIPVEIGLCFFSIIKDNEVVLTKKILVVD